MNISPLLLCLVSASVLTARADWPRWRGANFDDISTEKALTEWPKEGPKQLWLNNDVGLGYSGYANVGDTVYTMGARDVTEFVIAVDAATGKEKWATEIGGFLTNN